MQLLRVSGCAKARSPFSNQRRGLSRAGWLGSAAGAALLTFAAVADADPTPTAPPAAPATPDATPAAPTAGPSAPPTAAAAPMPSPMSSPSMTAPLSANPNPASFDAGPLGKVYVTGQVTALGLAQSHHAPGDATAVADLSNGQVEIQTTSGPVQFYVQAGAYSLPAVGAGYTRSGFTTTNNFGALPVAYGKLVLTPEVSVQLGALPTLIGAEYTFTFQNMNIERGLLWYQEPAVSKGVQLNYAKGPLTLSVSLNDGYDSDHYNWISGLASFAFNSSNTMAFAAGGDFGHTTFSESKYVAPFYQSNSSIYNVLYTFSSGPLTLNPYVQYSHVDADSSIGIAKSASTWGVALLAKDALTPAFSVAGRLEYIDSSGGACSPAEAASGCADTVLLPYGAGTNAWSITLTPTYQKGVWFARGEVSYARIGGFNPASDAGFGATLSARDQVRGLFETGFLF